MSITVERLLALLTPITVQCYPELKKIRLSKSDFNIRTNFITAKCDNIINILKLNHWNELEKYINTMPQRTNPNKFMLYIRHKSLLLYDYILSIHVMKVELLNLADRVENFIEYEELCY